MKTTRWLIFAALVAFVPVFWYMVIVGGWVPTGAILLMALRNLSDGWIMFWCGLQLVIYGALFFWLAGRLAKLVYRFEETQRHVATGLLLIFLASIGLLPIFGAAHGTVERMNAYQLYASGKLH